jgi:hypothetical protein
MAELTVIYWRDIPAQVTAKEGRQTSKAVLSERFQEAIDAAATRVGLIGTDDYLAQWRRVTRPCDADLETVASAEAARLEAEFTDDALAGLVRTGGAYV